MGFLKNNWLGVVCASGLTMMGLAACMEQREDAERQSGFTPADASGKQGDAPPQKRAVRIVYE